MGEDCDRFEHLGECEQMKMKGKPMIEQKEPLIATMQNENQEKNFHPSSLHPEKYKEQNQNHHPEGFNINFDKFWFSRCGREVTVVKKNGERVTGMLRVVQPSHTGVILVWTDPTTKQVYNRYLRGDAIEEILMLKKHQSE
jgi:hypothetical protein